MKLRRTFKKLTAEVLILIIIWSLCVSGAFGQQGRGAGVKPIAQTSDKRLALVIGNSAYQNIDKLKNPVNDATDIAAELKKLGFEVALGTDLNLAQMRKMVREFGVRLHQEKGFGLFYYAGHGVQVEGRNYLVPVEANIQTAIETQDSALDSDTVLRFMREAGNEFNLIIMDACRNNPFADSWRKYSPNRAIGENKGLARITPPSGTIILYSTEPGSTASDGTGKNGLFTESLLQQIDKPNVEFDQMVKIMARDVKQKSGGTQSPWKEGIYDGDFYFAGNDKPTSVSNVTQPASVSNAAEPADSKKVEVEAQYWGQIEKSTNAEDFNDYLSEYPNGHHASQAKQRLKEINKAKSANDNSSAANNTNSSSKIKINSSQQKKWYAMIRNKDYDMVVAQTTDELQKNSRNISALRIRSLAYFGKKDKEKGNQDMTAVLNILDAPKTAEEYEARCWAQRGMQKNDDALNSCLMAVSLDPKFADAHETIGNLYSFKRDYENAKKYYTKAIELSPDNVDFYKARVSILEYFLKDYDGAIADYTKIIEFEPQKAYGYCERSSSYHFKKDIQRAFADIDKAKELDPNNTCSYFNRALIYKYDLKDYDRALIEYSKIIELEPNEGSYYYYRAGVYREKKQYDLAIADYTKAIELSPQSYMLYSWYMDRGNIYKEKGDYDNAIVDLSRAISLSPDLYTLYYYRAQAYEARGDTARAAADRQKSSDLQNQKPK